MPMRSSATRRSGTLLAVALAALAAGAGAGVGGGCRDRDENTPIARIDTPFDAGGREIPVEYALRNRDTKRVNIDVSFSSGRKRKFEGATAAPGGEGTTNLRATGGGAEHIFLWDAAADLGPGRREDVRFKVKPRIGGRGGDPDTTGHFTVDNTDLSFLTEAAARFDRRGHAAAELPDGRVLIAGGVSAGAVTLDSAEIYDPVADLFLDTDALVAGARSGATATLYFRADGRPFVLVAGGIGPGGTFDELERFDPETETFSLLGPALATGRSGHTATILADGRILLAGGFDASGAAIGDAEVFDGRTEMLAAAAVSIGIPRGNHTATSIEGGAFDGRVLLAGGETEQTGAGTVLASAALSNADVTAFAPTSPGLATRRTNHAAAPLARDGRVVVAGGSDGTARLDAIELFDPEAAGGSGAFVPGPSPMSAPRELLTATALPDGSVLLAGGTDGGTALDVAERFVPADPDGGFPADDQLFVSRAPLAVPRTGHRAVRLGSGRVLVVGGGSPSGEVYFPPHALDSEASNALIELPSPRVEHEVTALDDGLVLVTGGTDGVVEAGGGGGPRPLATAEVLDARALPGEEVLPVLPAGTPLAAARRLHTATRLADGRVLVAGGLGAGGAPLASLEVFDPETSEFEMLDDALAEARSGHSATLLPDGRVLLAGGFGGGGAPLDTAELFDPAAPGGGAVEPAAGPLVAARALHTATDLGGGAEADGRVLLVGGVDGGGAALASAELFDPATGDFEAAGDLSEPREAHVAVLLLDGRVLVAGGRNVLSSALASAELFDPATGEFAPTGEDLAEPRAEAFAARLDEKEGRVLVAGGMQGEPAPPGAARVLVSAELYDPAGDDFDDAIDVTLAAPRRGAEAAVLVGAQKKSKKDPSIAIAGGRAPSGAAIAGAERFLSD